MTNVTKLNLDHIADDIRHVTEILKASNDEAERKRLDLLQADITQAMMDFGMSPVVDRIVAARNDALVKGTAW